MVADAGGGAMRRKVIASRHLVPRLMLTKVDWVCKDSWYSERSLGYDALVLSFEIGCEEDERDKH